MRYAVIVAGGSGTRMWPMSRQRRPKQLLPLVGGRCLLELAFERLEDVVDPERRLVCAAETDRREVVRLLGISDEQFLGEPVARDTLAAVAFTSAVIARRDAEAVIGVFTADHLIEPLGIFRQVVAAGYEAVESRPEALLTFGITPTHAATGYGYLELAGTAGQRTRQVRRFKEKPDQATARRYLEGGPERFLWNSGMFVWKAVTFLSCVRRYEPSVYDGAQSIADAWDEGSRLSALDAAYPTLKKISVDYGILEPASADPAVPVLAIPMPLSWRDIGSWTAYSEACPRDEHGNTLAAARSVLMSCRGTLVASTDSEHLIAALGCEDLIIIHTETATLVCPMDRAQEIKELHARIRQEHGEEYV